MRDPDQHLDAGPHEELHHQLDRAIGARFGTLHGTVAAAVPLPGAEEIIARGRRRRRNAQAGVAGLAVLAVLAVVSVVFGPLRPDRTPLPPADPSPSVTPAYVPPPGAARAPLGGALPPGFLPVEGTPAPARLEPLCPGPASFDSNASIVASAAGDGTALIVYPMSGTATRAYEEYRAEVERCAGSQPGVRLTVDPLELGGQSFQVITSIGARVTGYEMVIRYGRSLLLVAGPTDAAVRRAGDLERTLCVFAVDCAPREGRPRPVTSLSAGGQAWAAVLAIDPAPQARTLGHAVATAARMGYRTSVTSVDCDQGARAALGLPTGSTHRYVAVYFDSRADAEEFASSSLLNVVANVPVATYCLA